VATSKEKKRIAELEEEKASLERMLAIASDALKKLRQMRGAAAHERSWHYENRIAKTTARLGEIQVELSQLDVSRNT
jgi:hypothetical protein